MGNGQVSGQLFSFFLTEAATQWPQAIWSIVQIYIRTSTSIWCTNSSHPNLMQHFNCHVDGCDILTSCSSFSRWLIPLWSMIFGLSRFNMFQPSMASMVQDFVQDFFHPQWVKQVASILPTPGPWYFPPDVPTARPNDLPTALRGWPPDAGSPWRGRSRGPGTRCFIENGVLWFC